MRVLLTILFIFYTVQREIATFSVIKENIVGGTRAANDEFSYLVSLRFQQQHNCGGVLITQQHVLTAAHCLMRFVPGGRLESQLDQLNVVVGTANLFAPGQKYKVEAIYPHENYNHEKVFNDIGIVKLAENVSLSQLVSTISLPKRENLEPKTKLTMIGFGTYFTGDPVAGRHPISAALRKVEVETLSLDECQELWGDTTEISKTNICTSTDNDIGSCMGDSGGPLIYQGVIQGIVSYGEGNCAEGIPDVATKVGSYLDWIDTILNKADNYKPMRPYIVYNLESKTEATINETDSMEDASPEIEPIHAWDIRIKKVKP